MPKSKIFKVLTFFLKIFNYLRIRLVIYLKKLFDTIKIIHRASKLYNRSFYSMLSHSLGLLIRQGFRPEEAFYLGLLNPETPPFECNKYVSKRKMVQTQNTLNPSEWIFLTRNKGAFYRYCQGVNLPIPELYAIFFKNKAGWSAEKVGLKNHDDWCNFFNKILPNEFVIKPCIAAYGSGLYIFKKVDTGFVDSDGKTYSASDLYGLLNENPSYDNFVIQQRLKGHPDFVKLSNSHYLQTIRVITFVDKQQRAHILLAYLRSISGGNIMDNHEHGKTGNLLAMINLETGTIKKAVTMTDDGSGVKHVKCHPETNIQFEGFQIPLWGELCELAKKTAIEFTPVRNIGWDIAITPDGLFIVEGNSRYDPPSWTGTMDTMLQTLADN